MRLQKLNTSGFSTKLNPRFFRLSSFITRFIIICALLSFFSISHAETYYVSNSGNDSNAGNNESQAWLSLEKVNSFSFSPGDQILFKRGDEWKGGILLNQSGTPENPIIYGAYGVGEKPIFHGDRRTIGWSHHEGNIYKATVSNPINQLSWNDETMQLARYPDSTYLYMSSIASNTTFSCEELPASDWVGATAILRLVPWGFEAKKISGSSGNSLTIESFPYGSYAMNSGDPFFIINSLTTLDSPGQWVYEESTNTLYFWPPEGSVPNDESVRVSIDEYGFKGTDISFVNIQDICISGFQKDGILLSGLCSNITIHNTDLINNYECGIHVYDDEANNNIVISDNLISGSNRDGIRLTGINCSITNNTIQNISLMANIGLNAFIDSYNTASGILLYPISESLISHNKLDNIGYNGIMFYGTNNSVEYNRINRACLTLQDGGGIYSHLEQTGSVLKNNIISNCGPANDQSCFGIYMDATSVGMTIEDNTVFSCSRNGIFTSNCSNITVSGNTLFDNNVSQYLARHHVEDIPMFNNIVSGNVFFAKTANNWQSSMNLWASAGLEHGITSYNNVLGCPEENSIAYYLPPWYWDRLTIEEYQQISGNGQGSSRPVVSNYENAELFYNDTTIEKTFYFDDVTYRDLNGDLVSILVLQPFTSQILVAE